MVDEWDWDVPLRLLGGLHFLVLSGRASWEDVRSSLVNEGAFLRDFVAEQRVQTNEVQRSWVLAPLFLRAAQQTGARELDLVELGPSAGLNLVWDRYRCVYEAGARGPNDAALVLRGEERRAVPSPVLAGSVLVGRRVGIDRSPVDVTSEDGARLLTSFVWADQSERIQRLHAAIAELRRDPPELVRTDFLDVLPDVLAARRGDALTVVFQTAVLAYVGDAGRGRVREALEAAGASGPLAFVSAGRPRVGADSWGLRITYWPGGRREFVGHADYHGAWLDWEAA